MAEQLTPGCTLAIRNNTAERGQIVQVIDVRRLQAAAGAAPGADRYRIVVSDGTYFQPGMVSTQLHELVSTLQINAVIRLDNWSLNNVGGRVIVIVLALTIIHPNCGERIGTPVSIEQVGESGGNGGGQPYPQQGQGAQQQQPPDQAQQQAQFGNGGYGAPQQQQANNAYGQPQQQQQPYGYGVPQQQQQQYAPQPPQMNSYGQALQQGNPYEQHGGPQMGQQQQGYGQQQQQPPQQGYGGGAAYGGGGGYGQDNSNNNNNNNNGGYGGAVEGAQWQQQPPQQQQQQQGGYGGGGYGGGGGGGGGYGGGDQGGGNGGAGYFNGGGNGPVHRQAEDAVTMPIPALNPYQNRWAIKGRITAKGSKKQYTNAKGEGTLFSFTVCDNDGDIRLTCFNEVAIRLWPIVNEGEVVVVRNGQIKAANDRWNNCSSKYEITLGKDSEVTVVTDPNAVATVPEGYYNLVTIAQLGQIKLEPGGQGQTQVKQPTVDVIGVLTSVGEVTTFTNKSGKEMIKRLVEMADEGASIDLTVWGDLATNFSAGPGDIVMVKGGRLSDWSGRSLSSNFDGGVHLHPNHERAVPLKAWYTQTGAQGVTALSNGGGGSGATAERKTILAVQEEQLGMSKERPDLWSIKCTTMQIRSQKDLWYAACGSGNHADKKACKKKVLGDDAQGWHCEGCQWQGSPCNRRYIGRFQVSDSTGSMWMEGFDEVFSVMLCTSADALCRLKDVDESAYNDHLRDNSFNTYIFTVKSRLDDYQGEARTRHATVSVKPLDIVEEALAMLADIKAFR